MTQLAVLIPVKSSDRKSRLSGLLSESERGEFTELLLTDVLGVVRRAGLIRACHVVSSDERTWGLAERLGARVIEEPGDMGVNSAVTRGIRRAGRPDVVLVLPSDLPLLGASEVKHLLALKASGLGVVLAPSLGFDGTNALMFSTASALSLSYDNDSFWNHLAAASRGGHSVGVCTGRGVMFDVDSPEDFRALARTGVDRPSAAFARRALR